MNYRWEFLKRNKELSADIEQQREVEQQLRNGLRDMVEIERREVAKFQEIHGRKPNRQEEKAIAKAAFRKTSEEGMGTAIDRLADLIERVENLWGIRQTQWAVEYFGKQEPPEHDKPGRAAMVVLSPSPEPRISITPKKFEELLLQALSEPVKYLKAESKKQGSEAVSDYYAELVRILPEDTTAHPKLRALSSRLLDSISNYMRLRTSFFRGYSSFPFRYGIKRPRGREWRLKEARLFLIERELSPWLAVEIDTSRPSSEIWRDVSDIVKVARKAKKAEGIDVRIPRSHARNFERYLEVWDLRVKRLTFEEIARQVYPREYGNETRRQRAVDRVKKQFAAAYRLIYEREYRRRPKTAPKRRDMSGFCEPCPKWSVCTELCPDALAYVEQDERKSVREVLKEDIAMLERNRSQRPRRSTSPR